MKVKHNFVTEIKGVAEEKDASGVSFGFFEGYAATFGNIDRVDDIIEKGAFSSTLSCEKPRRLKLLWQHYNSELIGSITEAKEDDHGLFIKGRINLGTKQGQEAHALLKAGDIDEMSIGFSMNQDDFEYNDDGVRIIKRVDLREVSLVTEPANTEAKVTDVKQVNDAIDGAESLKDMESILQEKFSRKQACAIVSKIKKFLPEDQGELDESDEIVEEKQLEQSESGNEDASNDHEKLLGSALAEIKMHQTITKLKG